MKPIFATSGCSTSRCPTTRARADDDVDDALRYPGLEDQLGEPQRGERRQLGRLQDDGVAAGERGAELPAGDVEREVPGHDQPDDAERLAEGHVDAARDRDRLAVVLVDGAGVEVEDLRDHADLGARAGDRLADVLRLDPRELLGVLLDERCEPAQQARAIGGSNGAPFLVGRLGASDRRVCLLDPGRLELGDRLLGGGVGHDQSHLAAFDHGGVPQVTLSHVQVSDTWTLPAATKSRKATRARAGLVPKMPRRSPSARKSDGCSRSTAAL